MYHMLVSHPNFDMANIDIYQTNIIIPFFFFWIERDFIEPPKPTEQQRGQTPQPGSCSSKIIITTSVTYITSRHP